MCVFIDLKSHGFISRGLLDIQTPYFRGKMSQNVLMTGRRYEKTTYTPEVRSRKVSPRRDGEQVKE